MKRRAANNYFLVPNEMLHLELKPGEIAVYNYLLFCENRKTYQCYPSYSTIGRAIGVSKNTVQKYVSGLEEKGLIATERTTILTKTGQRRNGNLLYTIRPIQEAVNLYYERQFAQAKAEADFRKHKENLV